MKENVSGCFFSEHSVVIIRDTVVDLVHYVPKSVVYLQCVNGGPRGLGTEIPH